MHATRCLPCGYKTQTTPSYGNFVFLLAARLVHFCYSLKTATTAHLTMYRYTNISQPFDHRPPHGGMNWVEIPAVDVAASKVSRAGGLTSHLSILSFGATVPVFVKMVHVLTSPWLRNSTSRSFRHGSLEMQPEIPRNLSACSRSKNHHVSYSAPLPFLSISFLKKNI